MAALVIGTLKARVRLRRLPRLGDPGSAVNPQDPSAQAARELPGEYRWITTVGVQPDDALTAAATSYAQRTGLLVLDLVPGDLGVNPLGTLLRDVNPAAFRGDPVAAGRGACHALLVHDSVLGRVAEVARTRGLATAETAELTVLLKRYAPRAMGHVVAPGLAAIRPDPREAKARFRALGAPSAAVLGGMLGEAGAFAGATYATPFWGVLGLAVWWVQPYAILAGRPPVRPRRMHTETLLRPFLAVVRWVRAATGPAAPPAHSAQELAVKRAQYAGDAANLEHFFESRRDTCPWCSSDALTVRLRTKDRLQGKPGRFTLDRCRDCGHIFQNPRLSLAGLDYYYRDFYDGLGAEGAEAMFATMSRQYRGRARLVAQHATPARWLDVGTGHAHQCLVAKSELPDTVFDGLDLGGGVEEAARRGWIDRAYVGQFPDHADALAGAYDVVSMHHFLEHVRDPFAELDAAAKLVRPGGHLLIELPDPQCWYARLLHRRWHPWFQPQHQHLMPLRNLQDALTARGFTTVAVEHGPAHQGGLFVAAVTHTLTALAPDPTRPWVRGGPTLWRRGRRVAVIGVLVPFYVVAGLLDAVGGQVAGVLGRAGGSDAYRLLARKELG
ncbi:MAG: class I SAM-dependent methyltransferase [Streptomycetaceae bacterium]|nr:class I SAM-dependent methyltransferase [Streptomycetaceae bacterium]